MYLEWNLLLQDRHVPDWCRIPMSRSESAPITQSSPVMGQFCISSPRHTGTGCTGLQNDAIYSWNKIHLWLLNTERFPSGWNTAQWRVGNILGKHHSFLTSPSYFLLHICNWPLLETGCWAGWISGCPTLWQIWEETNLGKKRGYQTMKSPQDIWLSWNCCFCLKRVSGEGGGDAVMQIHHWDTSHVGHPCKHSPRCAEMTLNCERGLRAPANV